MSKGRRKKGNNSFDDPNNKRRKIAFSVRERIVPGSFIAIIPFAAEAIANMNAIDMDSVAEFDPTQLEELVYNFYGFEPDVDAGILDISVNNQPESPELIVQIDLKTYNEAAINMLNPLPQGAERQSANEPLSIPELPVSDEPVESDIQAFYIEDEAVPDNPVDQMMDEPEVPNKAPTTILNVDSVIGQGEYTTFDASDSFDLDGQIVKYQFDFGDGNTYTESLDFAPDGRFDGKVEYSFSDPGTVQVSVTATDDDGASDTAFQEITVTNDAPVFLTPGDTDPTNPGLEQTTLSDPSHINDDPATDYIEGSLDAVKNDGTQDSIDNIVQSDTSWTAIANAYDSDGSIQQYNFWIDSNRNGSYENAEFIGSSSTGEIFVDHTVVSLTAGLDYNMAVSVVDND